MPEHSSAPIVVLTTVADDQQAERLAHHLVEGKLAACVTRLGAKSTYRWDGKMEQTSEVLILIKTTQQRYNQLQSTLLEIHPYELPEVMALPVSEGSPNYLQWLSDSV